MCVNYSVAKFSSYFPTAPFMYNKLVLSSFMNRKEMSVDALMNREFCCHHIRIQKKTIRDKTHERKKLFCSRSQIEKLRGHQ